MILFALSLLVQAEPKMSLIAKAEKTSRSHTTTTGTRSLFY